MKRNKEKKMAQKKLLDSLLQEVNAQTYQVRTPIDNKKYVIH